MIEREPYPGLRPFFRDEVDIFFGRERQIDRMIEQLREHRFLAVTGTSGSGKSSLVRTGLLSALEAGFLDSAGGRWRILDIRPGSKPFAALVPALLKVLDLEATPADIELARAALERGPLSIAEFMERVPGGTSDSLLIVVDQFEELFRFGGRGIRDEIEAFVALLMGSVSQTKVPIYVVLTMRSDFLGDCAQFEGLPELINRSQYLTPRMSREEYRHAIEDPARVLGGRVAPSVTSRLLNDMVNIPDQLCLIQHGLLMMWRHAKRRGQLVTEIALEDYEAIGGLAEAISRHADEVLDAISLPSAKPGTAEDTRLSEPTNTPTAPDKLAITERLFRRLTEGSGRESDVRRPTAFGELLEVIDCSEADLRAVIEDFRATGNNFLTPLPHIPIEHDTVVDICHESLIRQWKRLRDWTDRESESAATYRRLEQTAILWRQGRAGLWPLPDVQLAIIWRKEQKPTRAWAKQYGKHFDTAISFLEESRKANQKALRRKWAVAFASIIGPFILAAVIYGWWVSAARNDKLARQSQELQNQSTNLAALQKETNQALQSTRDWRSSALKSQFHAILASAETELGKGRTNRARALTLEGVDLMRGADPSSPLQQDTSDYRRFINTLISTLPVDRRDIYLEDGAINVQEVSGAYSSNSKIVAWTSSNRIYFSDARTGIAIKRFATATESATLNLAPSGRLAALIGKGIELFDLDRGKLPIASEVIGREQNSAVAFAETAQGPALVSITKGGEFMAWHIAPDADRAEPISLLRKSGFSVASSSNGPPRAINCAGSRCVAFDGTRLRLFELNGLPREVVTGSVAADSTSGSSENEESKGEHSSDQRSILLVNDTVILGSGTRWSSYKIDETSERPSITAKPVGDWLKYPYALLVRGTSENLLGIVKVGDTTRFTSSKFGADEPTDAINGLMENQRIVALSPDGASALAVEESDDNLSALKVIQFTSTTDSCGDCSRLLTDRSGDIYLVSNSGILKFDPASKKFAPILLQLTQKIREGLSNSQANSGNTPNSIASDGSSTAPEDNPDRDLQLIGAAPDPDTDRVYVLFSLRSASSRNETLRVATVDLASGTVSIIEDALDKKLPDTAKKLSLAQTIDRSSFPRLVIDPWVRDADIRPVYISPGAEISNEKLSYAPRPRIRIANQMAISFNRQSGELEIVQANEPPASKRADPIRLNRQDVIDINLINDNTVFVAYRDGLIEFRDINQRDKRPRAIQLETKINIRRASWSQIAQKLVVVGRRPQGRDTTIVAWVDPISGQLTNVYEQTDDVIAVRNLSADTAMVVGDSTYKILSGMRTLEPEKVEEYARAVTPIWYLKSDIEKTGLLILDSKIDRFATGPTKTLPECRSPTLSEVLAAFGDEANTNLSKPDAYQAACSELRRANIAEGFKAWVSDQLTQRYLFGETKSDRNDVLRFELIRFAGEDRIASVDIVDRLLPKGDRCNSSQGAVLRQLQENMIVDGGVISPTYYATLRDCENGSNFDLKQEVLTQLENLAASHDAIAHAILGMRSEHGKDSQEDALAHYEAASTILYNLRRLLMESGFDEATQAWTEAEHEIGRRRSALANLLGAAGSLRARDRARQLLGVDPAIGEGPAMSELYASQTASARVMSMSGSDMATDIDKAEQKLQRYFGHADETLLLSRLIEMRYLCATRYLVPESTDEARKVRARQLFLGILRTAERTGANDSFSAAVAPLALEYFTHRPESDDEAFGVLQGIAYDVVYRESELSPPQLTTNEWARNLDLFARYFPSSDIKSQTQIAILVLGLKERDLSDDTTWNALREQQQRVFELLKQASSLDEYGSVVKVLSWAYVDVGDRLYESRSASGDSKKLSNDLDKTAYSVLMEGVKLHASTESLFLDDASKLERLARGNHVAGLLLYKDDQFDAAAVFFREGLRLRKAALGVARGKDPDSWLANLANAQESLAETIERIGKGAASRLDASSDWSNAWSLEQEAIESWRAAKMAGSNEAEVGLFQAFGTAIDTAILLKRNEEALVMSFQKYRGFSPQGSKKADILKEGAATVGYSIAAVFHDAQRAKGKNTNPTKCDEEVGHPNDPLLPGSGREFVNIEAQRAIEACDQALLKEPSNPRLIFERGRALDKKGDKKAATAAYQAASKKDYPISFNSIGYINSERGAPDEVKAQANNFYLEFFNRTVGCCGREAANYVLEKKTETDRLAVNQAAIELLDWAAELGDAAAHEDVARILADERTASLKPEWTAMSPSDRKLLRMRHLLIARRLYVAEKRNGEAQRATAAINASLPGMSPQEISDLREQAAEWRRKDWLDMPVWMMPQQEGRDQSADRRASGN